MTRWDKYLIVLLIIVSVLGMFVVGKEAGNNNRKYVVVTVDGNIYKKISVFPNMKGQTFDIETKYGYNRIEIKDEKVRVSESNCHNKLCISQGWISKPGEVVICLPHRLSVEIIIDNRNQDEDIDNISY